MKAKIKGRDGAPITVERSECEVKKILSPPEPNERAEREPKRLQNRPLMSHPNVHSVCESIG